MASTSSPVSLNYTVNAANRTILITSQNLTLDGSILLHRQPTLFLLQVSHRFLRLISIQNCHLLSYVRVGERIESPARPRKKDSEPKLQVPFHFGNSNNSTFDFEKQYTFSTPVPTNRNLKNNYIPTIFLTVFAVLIVNLLLVFALAVLDHQFVFW